MCSVEVVRRWGGGGEGGHLEEPVQRCEALYDGRRSSSEGIGSVLVSLRDRGTN